MGASPLFTLGATAYGAGAGAGAGAGGAGAAAVMSNPITAALAAIAAATAYGTSPTVRNKVNPMIKSGYEAVTNPFQHMFQGTASQGGGQPGLQNGFLSKLMGMNDKAQQHNNQPGQGGANGQMDFRPPNPIGMIGLGYNPPQGSIPTHRFQMPGGPF